ncbi:3-phosphoglycerate dehydrogenase family protein [Carnobacterium gallinarum]|uniref:3-phosphoglycerate dehydrogenase family protein n=1 Tax=Carnobacterium gallinarum TaxID=2749 RepID=UPI000556F944|nr:3-phosphoglycerate dehydrogenase family protein [Carnobacterium gallinarum]
MVFHIKTYNAIAEEGLQKFEGAEYQVNQSESPDALLIRSQNLHDIEIPDSVLAVGRAGAGVNNIPVEEYTEKGVVVFNTPGANANAVKELVLANLFMSARPILNGAAWTRTLATDDPNVEAVVEAEKKRFVGTELQDKKLGVIGLGAIGAMVANDAYRLGMNVVGYDPYVSVDTAWNISSRVKRALTIEEVLATSDYLTIHIPLMSQTKHIINAEKLALVKEGATLLNFSRGELVDNQAVLQAIEAGKLNQYITDFAAPELIATKNVLVLPHLGASTLEAEVNCAKMAARTLKYYLETGNIKRSVNFPTVDMNFQAPFRLSLIHRNVPSMVGTMTIELANQGINIVNMINRSKGEYAYTLIDLEDISTEQLARIVEKLESVEEIISVRTIENQVVYA